MEDEKKGPSYYYGPGVLEYGPGVLVDKHFCFKGDWSDAKTRYGKVVAYIGDGNYCVWVYDANFVKAITVLAHREEMRKYQWHFYDSLEEMRATAELANPTPEGEDHNENNA